MASTGSDLSEWPRLEGRQDPRLLSEWPGDDSDGVKAVELGRRVGKKAMPWQSKLLRAWMRRRPDGLWTHPECVAIIARQNGKTLLVIIRILWGLFLANDRRGERIVYSAQRWPTAEDVYKRVWAIIEARPWLNRRVTQHVCSGGRGLIVTDRGARCAFVTRSADLGKGFDEVDLVIYDEAYNLTDTQTGALDPTQTASANAQTIYLSTAVDEETMPNCHVLAAIRRRGLAREEDLHFAEWSPEDDMAFDDPETWRFVNPSYGVIQKPRFLRTKSRNANTSRKRRIFELEYLNRGKWPKAEDDVDLLFDLEEWSTMRNVRPDLQGPIALGLSRTRSRERWALAAAQHTTAGKVHVEVGYFRQATAQEVVAFIRLVLDKSDPVALVMDSHDNAKAAVPLLIAAEIEPELASTPQMAEACGGFLDDATSGQLSHAGDAEILRDAVADATKRELPRGDFVWDDAIGDSAAPLKAITLARWALITFGARAKKKPASPSTGSGAARAARPPSGDLDLMAVGF
ncbi:terminase large subunit [Gordonia phage PCoral7]|uniref:Terminase large subunit n=1 Tax=Gordonia phage Toast TaxID=2599852 RepID=A0A5J6TAT2_9CAUD|nr:terminase large subunit [Gordonia phage Toast]QFG08063.1 terminase large subunit [Gordonia phage Toast]UVF60510.1 terminase large subunit [Gordonia phage PCoral7]